MIDSFLPHNSPMGEVTTHISHIEETEPEVNLHKVTQLVSCVAWFDVKDQVSEITRHVALTLEKNINWQIWTVKKKKNSY